MCVCVCVCVCVRLCVCVCACVRASACVCVTQWKCSPWCTWNIWIQQSCRNTYNQPRAQRLADLQGLIAVSVSMTLHVTHHDLSICQFPDLFIIDASFFQSILTQALSQHTNFPIKAMEEQQMKKPIKKMKSGRKALFFNKDGGCSVAADLLGAAVAL